MRTLAHISDLHFGTAIPAAVNGLLAALAEIRPNLVVVSGDFTQRAKAWQFEEAQRLLHQIRAPKLMVPGNHDIPLFNLWDRFFNSTEKYRRFISPDLDPGFHDEEMIVLGINTARSLTGKNGRVSHRQMQLIRDSFCAAPPDIWKILVTHHPFIAPPGKTGDSAVGRAEETFLRIEGCIPDLALAGHYHMSYIGGTHCVYTASKGSTLVIQAGTAVSTRTRLEQNAFNVIVLEGGIVSVEVRLWDGARFNRSRREKYGRVEDRWIKLPDEAKI